MVVLDSWSVVDGKILIDPSDAHTFFVVVAKNNNHDTVFNLIY